jgi:uncharacterized membrane protein HdeD (DUF308 family)
MTEASLEKLVLGSCFVIAGLFLIVFHKEIRERNENWNARVPWFLQSSPRGGRILTVIIILLGALLIYFGIAQLLSLLVHQ